MKLPRILFALALLLLAGCETTHFIPGPLTSAPGPGPGPGPNTATIYLPARDKDEEDDDSDFADVIRGRSAIIAGTSVTNARVVTVPLFIEDAKRHEPSGASTPLFEARQHHPVTAPDGHQLTLEQFQSVRGSLKVECANPGTKFTLQLTGLVPNGVYTMWIVTFDKPGSSEDLSHLRGIGTLGDALGSQNAISASASGEGSLTVVSYAGPLSVMGTIGDCALDDAFEFHVVGAYHIGGLTFGPSLGPEGMAVEQFAFGFRKP